MGLVTGRRHGRDDAGFTLIELMVVVLIIAILLAIAIPTFLGARTRAQNRGAQSTLRNALTAELTLYTDSQAYVGTVAAVQAVEPAIAYITGLDPGTVNNQVAVAVSADAKTICLAVHSPSGANFTLSDVADTTGVWYGNRVLTSCTAVVVAASPAAQNVSGWG